PYLVLSVIREESRFDPRAISIAGAVGLMQLLPGTASGVAGATLSVAQLTQPEINIRLGTQFLGGLHRRFRGDVVLAVAGYNAGPGAAQRFGRMSRKDPDLFFERIPFLETRAYVQRVLQSYGIYRWLYR
ncbi:MAG: lytic transglycosylase domain-containing protein, partial [Armatimonadetes bacterium]|nr:lytic transglycosylase domain-containing protein [Armatimonadota bacterium]